MEKLKFMKLAIKEACKAREKDEVPIGAVVVLDGKVVARAHNLMEKTQLATAHAEILAINKACKKLAGVKDVEFKYWKSELPYMLIDAVLAFNSGDMNYAFRKVRFVLSDLLVGNNLEAKRKFVYEIEVNVEWNARIFGFLKQVPSFSLSFKEWSEQTCTLLNDYWKLGKNPVFVPYQRKTGYKMQEMADVPVERYHQSSDKGSEYHKSIDTIHAVKGATFDAVLIFLSSDSRGQSISLKDFPANGVEVMTESQRMIYVACSRATQFLALAVPSRVTDQKIRNALSGVNIDIREINLQRELALD